MKMDVEKEYNKLKDSQFWKPQSGKEYKVTVTGEPVEKVSKFKDNDGDLIVQMHVPVKIDGEEFTWAMKYSEGKNSSWGRIVTIAQEHNNKEFKGLEAVVYVMGEKIQRRYDIKPVDEKQETLSQK